MVGVRLILSKEPVSRLAGEPMRRPNVAVVYADHEGNLHIIDDGKPAGWWASMKAQYKTRYEVDMSDHERQVDLKSSPPLALGGVYPFRTSLSVGFRVRDPRQVIRRNVEDALTPVYRYVQHVCRDTAANFRIDQARDAEVAIEHRFARPVALDEGIDIYYLQARLASEHTVTDHLRAVDAVRGTSEIKLLEQGRSLELRRREHEALDGRPVDMVDMVKILLERDPENVGAAKDLLLQIAQANSDRQDRQDERHADLIRLMADRGLARREDLERYREQIGGSGALPAIKATPAAVGWDEPLPVAPPPRTSAVTTVVPVYLALDESLASNVEDLHSAVQDVYDGLTRASEVSGVIRLSVLGFAEEATLLSSLKRIHDLTTAPMPRPGGAARYAPLFDRLRIAIPADITALEARGSSVARPIAMVVTAGWPADPVEWLESRQALGDRTASRWAPDIMAFGVGAAPSPTILNIATDPNFAFVATTADVATAIRQFGGFARDHVLSYGRAILDGDKRPHFQSPAGFRSLGAAN